MEDRLDPKRLEEQILAVAVAKRSRLLQQAKGTGRWPRDMVFWLIPAAGLLWWLWHVQNALHGITFLAAMFYTLLLTGVYSSHCSYTSQRLTALVELLEDKGLLGA